MKRKRCRDLPPPIGTRARPRSPPPAAVPVFKRRSRQPATMFRRETNRESVDIQECVRIVMQYLDYPLRISLLGSDFAGTMAHAILSLQTSLCGWYLTLDRPAT